MKALSLKNRWAILNRSFLGAVITTTLIELTGAGSSLANSIMTSRMLGSEAMAAVSLTSPLFNASLILSGVLALGMNTLCTREIGRGNIKALNEINSAACMTGLAGSVLTAILLFLFASPVARLLGAKGNSADLFELTVGYVRGLSIGIPAIVLVPLLSPSLQLDNDDRLVRVSSLVSVAANVLLNWLFIRLQMGIFGVGLATSVSRYLGLSVLLVHFTKEDRMLRPQFRIACLSRLKEILPKGSPNAVRRLAGVIRPLLTNNYIILLGGTSAVTALSVRSSVSTFAHLLGGGIAGAVSLAAGVAYGEKSREDIRQIGKLAHRLSYFGNGLIAAFCILFASPITSVFLESGTETYDMAVFAIRMVALELISLALLEARISYLNAISKQRYGQLIQLGIKLVFNVTSVYIMGYFWGVYGVLAAPVVTFAVMLIVVYIVTAVRERKLKPEVEDYLLLDDSFNIGPGDVIELDVRGMEDAAVVAHQVQLFCKGHGFDRKKCFYAALSLDESVRLIYERNGNDPKLSIDLRVVVQDDDLILRIRDNGKVTCTLGESEQKAEEDIFAGIGFRLLKKAAKDISYYHSLKVNYTLITV